MLTPQQIESKQFTVVRARAGYSQPEVDNFLDEIVTSYKLVYQELERHRGRLSHVSEADTQVIPSVAIPEQITQASKLLELAQRAADDQAVAAKISHEQIVQGARDSGKQIIRDAKAEATRLLEDATREKHAEVGRLEDKREKLQARLDELDNHRKMVAERLAAALREVEDEARNED